MVELKDANNRLEDALIDEFYAVLMGINIGAILIDSRFTEIDKGILLMFSWFYIVLIIIIYNGFFIKPIPKFRRTKEGLNNPWIWIFVITVPLMVSAIIILIQAAIIFNSVQGYFLFFGGVLWFITKMMLRRGNIFV